MPRHGRPGGRDTMPVRPMPAWADGRRHPVRRRSGAWVLIAIGVAVVIVYGATSDPPPAAATAPLSGTPERIVDGDTLDVAGLRIRLAGIDAPELQQTCGSPAGGTWSCGIAARQALRDLAAGPVNCTPSGSDRYGRTLATCRSAGRDVAGALVEAGLALGGETYRREEGAARAAGRGLWQGRFDTPADWRRDARLAEAEAPLNPSRFERFIAWLLEALSG